MNKLRLAFNTLIIVLTIIYPFFMIYALNYLPPRVLALILAGLFLLRFLFVGKQKNIMPIIALICFVFLIIAAWANQINYLLIYPVLVSSLFFLVFSLSLIIHHPLLND